MSLKLPQNPTSRLCARTAQACQRTTSPVLTVQTRTPDSDDDFGGWNASPDLSVRNESQCHQQTKHRQTVTRAQRKRTWPKSPYSLKPPTIYEQPPRPIATKPQILAVRTIGFRPATQLSTKRPVPIKTATVKSKSRLLLSLPFKKVACSQTEASEKSSISSPRLSCSPSFRLYEPALDQPLTTARTMPSMPHSLRLLRPAEDRLIRYVSVTPEPKRPRLLSDNAVGSAASGALAELLQACKALGVRPKDVLPRKKTDCGERSNGEDQEWKTEESQRMQKLRMLQKEIARRRSGAAGNSKGKPHLRAAAPPQAVPQPPVAALNSRLEYINSKVLSSPLKRNQRLALEHHRTGQEFAAKSEWLDRRRQEILRKITIVSVTQLHHRRERNSPARMQSARGTDERLTSMKTIALEQNEWEMVTGQELEAIAAQLANLESDDIKARGDFLRKGTMHARLERLRTIREQRRDSGTNGFLRRKTSETPRIPMRDTPSYEFLAKQHTVGSQSPRNKHRPDFPRRDTADDYISLLHDYSGDDQERILMKWRKAERSLFEIHDKERDESMKTLLS